MKNLKKILKQKGFIGKNTLKQAVRQYTRFCKYSILNKTESDEEFLITKMRIITHDIEKGFSLPEPRKGFGRNKILQLCNYIKLYENYRYDLNALVYKNAISVIQFYINNKKKYGFNLQGIEVQKFLDKNEIINTGICVETRSEIDFKRHEKFEGFSKSRHSIREFDDKQVNEETIIEAIKIAQSAPSACNRQSISVINVDEKIKCKQIIDLQGGAKGFSEINNILILVSDLSLYTGLDEVNTCYRDSGLFEMNLLYSLHYFGIASCPLLWNDDTSNREKIRNIISIPEKYVVTAIIPIGYYCDGEVKYATSVRKSIQEVYLKV